MTSYPPLVEDDLIISDFQFSNGQILPELRLHFTTLGHLAYNEAGRAQNAVLILHGTGGSGHQFLQEHFANVLFGPGQRLDASRFFIILPDGIGHGKSSKPSDGLRAAFPAYTYTDMVTAQYRLLTEKLGVDHLRLVMGTSMGGMHTWLWGCTHPDFMDALLPLACLPAEIAGRNRMMRRMISDAIRTDPEWQNGNYTTPPRGLLSAIYTLIFMISAPLYWQHLAPTAAQADALFAEMVQEYFDRLDANDLLFQIEASRDYNPAPALEKIMAPLLAINFADDLVNPPELEILEKAMKRVRQGRYVLIPASKTTRGHRTHTYPQIWQRHLAAWFQELA